MAVSGPDGAVDHVRIARLAAIEQRIRIHRGDDLIVTADLTAADPMAEPVRIGYSLPEVLDRVQVGDRVYFDTDSHDVRDDARPLLEAQAGWLR